MAHGVTRMIKVSEMAAAVREVSRQRRRCSRN
jgi:hypothetical protein